MMKIIRDSEHAFIRVMDGPGQGGANHVYHVCLKGPTPDLIAADINFQNGPIQESGVNGCQQEDLLAVVIHRLQSFQAGPFPSRENALALTHCQEALHWLEHRTADRRARNVEGKNEA